MAIKKRKKRISLKEKGIYKPIKRGKPLVRKSVQGPPSPKKKQGKLKSAISDIKLKAQAAAGGREGRKAVRGMGPNVGIGVSGETKKAHAKAVKKTQRKRKVAAAVKKVKSALSGKKRAKQVRKIKKMQKAGMKVSRVKSVPLKETQPSGRIRKGAKKVLATKGGAYASYEKGSKAAGSFRKAFKSGCAGGAKSFSWDGRSYSCKKK